MNFLLLRLIAALLVPLPAWCAEPLPAIVVSIERLEFRTVSVEDSGPRFLAVVWASGRIAWSRDQQKGGAPYLAGQVEPARVTAILDRYEKRGVFAKASLRRLWFGPDSSYHQVWLSSGARRARLQTWHELFEENPKTVVINGGVTALNGRDREEVIRNDTPEFREFRSVWRDLRADVAALIPGGGEPFEGVMVFKLAK